VAILNGSWVAASGLTLDDLIWQAVDAAGDASELVRECEFLLMVSVDPLDARGISCMTVGGLLHRIPEHTRVDNGAFALLLAQSIAVAKGAKVCVLGWEKPTDTSAASLVALAGEPHYERPLHWTAGIEEALAASRTGQSTVVLSGGDRAAPADRAACIVVGPGSSGPTLAVRRVSGGGSPAEFGRSPMQFPCPSPVEPLRAVAARIDGVVRYAVGPSHDLEVAVSAGGAGSRA
jgi:hypothetical protein